MAADTGSVAGGEPWTPPSWEEIVSTHSTRIYRLSYRLTGNQHDAEDLTQEVFVRVFRSLSTYTPGTFQGWLHRITTNLFLDQARRRQRIRFDALPDDASERLTGNEPTPSQVYDEQHFDADVQAALDGLAPEFRAAVVLCDIEGLSYEEIATTLGVKLGTVRSRIHRGRAHLRAALAHRIPHRRRRNAKRRVAQIETTNQLGRDDTEHDDGGHDDGRHDDGRHDDGEHAVPAVTDQCAEPLNSASRPTALTAQPAKLGTAEVEPAEEGTATA